MFCPILITRKMFCCRCLDIDWYIFSGDLAVYCSIYSLEVIDNDIGEGEREIEEVVFIGGYDS